MDNIYEYFVDEVTTLQNDEVHGANSQLTREKKERLNILFSIHQSELRKYLQWLHSRGQSSKLYFNENSPTDRYFPMSHSQLQQQMLLLPLEEENAQRATEREHEVNNIVKFEDLNDTFKEPAHRLSDQGTILDQVECNIQRLSQVSKRPNKLKRANRNQRGNRKMCCSIM